MVLNNNNNKIMVVIKQLPEEVRNDDKYTTYLREVTKEELLAFLYLICKLLPKLRQHFSLCISHPIFQQELVSIDLFS